MSSILPLPSSPTLSPSSTDVSAIIPGTIFQDDIPPSFVDGAGPEQSSPPSKSSGDGSRSQIEVNPTIQIVLVSLGIVVGALFLLGIAAAYYISRKNKLASMKKLEEKSLPPIPEASAKDLESGPGLHDISEHRQLQHASSFSSNAMLLGNEKDGSVHDSIGHGHSRSSTPATLRYPAITENQSGAAGPTTASSVGSQGHNKRNSYVNVAQAYSRRQSQSHIISPAAMAHRMSMALDPSITGTGTIDLHTGIPAYFLSQEVFMSTASSALYGQCGGSPSPASPPPSSAAASSFFHDHSMPQNNSAAYLGQSTKCASGSSSPPLVPSKDCSPLNSPRHSLNIGQAATPISMLRARPANAEAAITSDISYQPPSQPTSPTAPAFDRGALQRSSTVLTADNGFKNEGSPWHRKRASVVVPDGTAPVRLWKGDAAAVATASGSSSSASSMVGPSRVRVFSSQDELQSRYQSGGLSRVARNGAAVFEGVAPHRSGIIQRRSLEESSPSSQIFPRRWAAGQIAVGDEETVQDRHPMGWVHSPQDSGSFIPYGRHSKGASLDDSLEEKVVISLPSPRGCLLEAEVEAMEIQDAYGWQHQHLQTHASGDEECARGGDPSALEHPYPKVVKRNPKHLRDKVVNSYLDDYREQQQQHQQEEQRKSLRQSVMNDGEISDGSASGSNSGRKRPARFLHSALQRASLYASGRSSPPPPPPPPPALIPETASFPVTVARGGDVEETILGSD